MLKMGTMNELDHLFARFNSLVDPSLSSALFAAAHSGMYLIHALKRWDLPPPPLRFAWASTPLHPVATAAAPARHPIRPVQERSVRT